MKRKVNVKIEIELKGFEPEVGEEIEAGESALEWFRSGYSNDWSILRDLHNGRLKIDRINVVAVEGNEEALFPDFAAMEGEHEWTRYLEGE